MIEVNVSPGRNINIIFMIGMLARECNYHAHILQRKRVCMQPAYRLTSVFKVYIIDVPLSHYSIYYMVAGKYIFIHAGHEPQRVF